MTRRLSPSGASRARSRARVRATDGDARDRATRVFARARIRRRVRSVRSSSRRIRAREGTTARRDDDVDDDGDDDGDDDDGARWDAGTSGEWNRAEKCVRVVLDAVSRRVGGGGGARQDARAVEENASRARRYGRR